MHVLFAVLIALTQPWLLVSDLHVDPFDRDPAPSGYKTDTNWPLFQSALAEMRKADPQAPVVIIAGDFLAHQFENKSHAAKLNAAVAAERTMARIANSFDRAFPHAQFVIALGNNDDPCGDYGAAPDTAYMRALARIWSPLVDRNGAAPDFVRMFSHAGYYTARLPLGERAIVLDDVYWSIVYHACGARAASVPAAQAAWLNLALGSTHPGSHEVLVMHIPAGIDPTATLYAHRFLVVPFWRASVRSAVFDALRHSRGRVELAIAGHTHRSDFRLAFGVPMLVAPAVSPIYSNNPAFLVLQMGADNVLHDYRMYAYDETQATWSQNFDFARDLGANRFTVTDLRALHERIAQDPALRDRWEHAIVSDSDAWYQIRAAWPAFWCSQTAVGGSYAGCAGDQRRVLVLRIALGALGALLLAVFVTIIVRLARQRRIR